MSIIKVAVLIVSMDEDPRDSAYCEKAQVTIDGLDLTEAEMQEARSLARAWEQDMLEE